MNYIKKYREKAGLSQEAVAKVMGVTQQSVAKWEAGEAFPRAVKLPLLAETLRCTVDELFSENADSEKSIA